MEERATSRSTSVASAIINSSVWFWLSIALIFFCTWLNNHVSARQSETTGSGGQLTGPPVEPGDVHALARLEPASGLIIVGARPGARIERIEVGPAASVTPGQVLAILEGHDQALAQLALAEAQKTRALHQRSVQKQKLALQREQFDKLQKSKLESAMRVFSSRQRFDEITKLYKELQPTLQGKDRFDLELRYFEAETQSLRGELEIKSYQIAQELAPRQRELEDEELGEKGPDLDLLDRQMDVARAELAQTEVRAPLGGRVLELMAHAGEVSSGPLLAMGDLSAMVATAEVFQADIPRLRTGDPATVQVLDQAVTGKVTLIGSIVGKNQLTNLDPRALQDRRVVKVTIGLDDPVLAARFVNMQVEAAIKPGAGTVAKSAAGTAGR
ncbi:MAG: HlyD family efflux transporter periplasmic adaptor subunit [Planctomycetaceae bacterium]|nr:HlyD family efflux transporter periplasmic adaptor subunit [Planctomycetaceae bacterium]